MIFVPFPLGILSILICISQDALSYQVEKCCEITKQERQKLITILKCLSFKIKKLRPIEEAVVTSGGISVDQVNPKTMESKLTKGLYFAGEVLDVDAFTGGFNLQIAFSTAVVAGESAAQ